jgi:hypothetical protein
MATSMTTGTRKFAKGAMLLVVVITSALLLWLIWSKSPTSSSSPSGPTVRKTISLDTYRSCAARGSRFCVITTAELTEEWSQVYAIPPWYGPDFRLPEGATVEVRANRSNAQVFRQDWYGTVYLEKDGKFLPMDPETNPWRGAGASYIEIRAANAASVGKEFTAVISAMDRE